MITRRAALRTRRNTKTPSGRSAILGNRPKGLLLRATPRRGDQHISDIGGVVCRTRGPREGMCSAMPRRSIVRTVRVPPFDTAPEAQTITVDLRIRFPENADPDAAAHAVLEATTAVLNDLGTRGGWLILAPLP